MSQVDVVVTAAWAIEGHRDRPVQPDAGVAIGQGLIVDVGRADDLRARYPAATRRHFSEASLLPGLIDGHCHLTQPGDGSSYEVGARSSPEQRHRRAEANARRHLQAGVTTLRDLGSHADLFAWRDVVQGPLPRMLLYGRPLTPPGGHMHLFGGECSGPTGVAERAAENLAMGSDGIKLVASGGTTLGTLPHLPSFSTEEMAAASEVAHAQGKVITAHALPVEAMRRAADARIDGIEHLGFLVGPGESEFDPKLAERMVDQGMTFGTTLGVNLGYIALAERDLASDYELNDQRERSAYYIRNAQQLHRMGARLVAASDAGWKYTPFGEFATELRLLAAAGLSPLEVVHAATAGAAEYLRVPEVGRLEVGRAADLLVVDGDASTDVRALGAVRAVFAGGEQVVGGEATL
jgi:imidazolonepropionase-like amidohydrolase